MDTIPFTKMQGIGNDLILVDARSMPRVHWPEVAREMSDRHFGIGSDGILVILPSEEADARLRMFNCDGSEDVCGNGLRCTAVYLHEFGGLARSVMTLDTLAGPRRLRIHTHRKRARSVTVNMGEPIFEPGLLPARIRETPIRQHPLRVAGRNVRINCVSMGTPHAVIFVPRLPTDELFFRVSPLIEHHRAFPKRINVIWARVAGRHRIHVRIWERGVGESLGCGTGACAALVTARSLGLADSSAEVRSSGGSLRIRWDHSVYMTGPACKVFDGSWLLHREHLCCP